MEPSKYSDEQLRKFLFWVNAQLKSRFDKHIDTYFAICDVKNVAKRNINISQIKKVIPDVGNNNPELSPVSVIAKPGWVLNMMFATIKPFLHPNTLKKIVFVKEKEMTEKLGAWIPLEDLPEEYGG